LRLFKGAYFGIIFNAFIMGWVFLSLSKVLAGVTNLNVNLTLWITVLIVFIYSVASGFYGVVITDFFQYFLALAGSIVLACYSLDEVGGVSNLISTINRDSQIPNSVLDFIPTFSDGSMMSLSVFLSYIFVQWWAHKYADGGGKHIQRLLSAKDESHAFRGSALYTMLTYSLQIWPWIVTALCAMVIFRDLGDPEMAYPQMMALVLPNGLLGLVVVCLIGAFMSTIDTHLNLGASYIVNDIYKRFIAPDKSNAHYVLISRIMMGLLLVLSVIISKNMTSVGGAWKFLLTFASGAGAVWILRWFWWRINAWSEISAMLTSGISATVIAVFYPQWNYSEKLLSTVLISTLVWVSVTILTENVKEQTLRDFVARVKPPVFGWKHIYTKYQLDQGEPLSVGVLNVFLGLIVFFCFNFSLGHFILKSAAMGTLLLAVSGIGSVVLYKRFVTKS
jgi:Na+/proline symporter